MAVKKTTAGQRRDGMAGLFALTIDSERCKGNFLEDLFWGTFYQQHLGEEHCGLATYNQNRFGSKIKIRRQSGLFRPAFSQNLIGLEGTEGIGYCGSAREPLRVDSGLGELSVCFSGNVINIAELSIRLKKLGYTLERSDDIEVIVKLIAQGDGIIDGIKRMNVEAEGAYSLLVLSKEGIYAVCCPTAQWPLVIGEKEGAVAVASESGGFSNLGFKLVRDVQPGEIILMKDGQWDVKGKILGNKVQFCSFIWVYTAFPNGIFKGIPASLVRKKLGAFLARRDIERGFMPDIVAPVPDSGRFHAIGYHQEFCRQIKRGRIDIVPFYDEVLLKYPYAGRSYTPQTKEARDLEAYVKLLQSGERYQGKRVVICDDSIVRGTQAQTNLVPKLRDLGFSEIHLRISNPELLSYCPWGKTTKKGEVLASRLPLVEDRIRFLGVESLEYNTITDLIKAIGLPKERLCIDCDLPCQELES